MTPKTRMLTMATIALLMARPSVWAAESGTVQAIIPWEAEGQIFQVDTNTMMFLGSLEGVMYIESSKGEMHEAFVMCPLTQTIELGTGKSKATAHCEISASPDNVLYATMTCDGGEGNCRGKFTLIDGEGEFTGISGGGELRVRSPMRLLITDMAAGATLTIGSGLAIVKNLEYRIP